MARKRQIGHLAGGFLGSQNIGVVKNNTQVIFLFLWIQISLFVWNMLDRTLVGEVVETLQIASSWSKVYIKNVQVTGSVMRACSEASWLRARIHGPPLPPCTSAHSSHTSTPLLSPSPSSLSPSLSHPAACLLFFSSPIGKGPRRSQTPLFASRYFAQHVRAKT